MFLFLSVSAEYLLVPQRYHSDELWYVPSWAALASHTMSSTRFRKLKPIHRVSFKEVEIILLSRKQANAKGNTHSSSSVTISWPSSSASLKITNRSFRFVSPHLCNQLPVSFRQSTNQSPSHSPHFTHGGSCTSSSFLPSSTPSLFHSQLKTYLFHKSFPSYTVFKKTCDHIFDDKLK